MKKNILTKLRGSMLVYMLVIMTIVTIILVSMLGFITSQIRFSLNRVEKERAFQIAESGVYFYRWYLAHQTSGKTAQQISDFWETGGSLGFHFTADFEGLGEYTVEVTPPEPGSTIVMVKSTGYSYKVPDMKRTVQVRFRRPSWSEYIFLSNSFMNFGDEAEVWGKVHSNGGIRFDGIAHNTVSALPARFDDPSHGDSKLDFGVHTHQPPADPLPAPSYPWADGTVPNRSDIFMGGRKFPVPEVSFNGVTSDLANMKVEAQNGHGQYFDGSGVGRRVNIKSDGSYDICTIKSANTNNHEIGSYSGITSGASGSYSGTNGTECTTNYCCDYSSCPYIQNSRPAKGKCVTLSNHSIINNGIVFIENSVWLEGTINNKRMTVVAANVSGGNQADIYIGISNNNLRYATYNCNNMLGLVAQRDLLVLGSCPSNFVVDAALIAQTGKVGINDNGFSSKNSLTFNGAIASYLQPYFNNGVSGFAVRFYNFDNNLLYCPPPYFPTGTEYSIDLWEEI